MRDNVYIRQDDWELWCILKADKVVPELLHKMIAKERQKRLKMAQESKNG